MIEVSLLIIGSIIPIIISRSFGSAVTPGKSINVRSGLCGPEIVTFIGYGVNCFPSLNVFACLIAFASWFKFRLVCLTSSSLSQSKYEISALL